MISFRISRSQTQQHAWLVMKRFNQCSRLVGPPPRKYTAISPSTLFPSRKGNLLCQQPRLFFSTGTLESAKLSERKLMQSECDRVTKYGAATNVGLAVGKLAAGIAGNSVAIIADAFHSLSDLFSDLIAFYSVRLSLRPPDASYPYGRGKFESIGALSVAAVLVATGGGIGYHSIEKLSILVGEHQTLAVPTSVALVAAVASILSKEWLYHVTKNVATRFNSKVIMANAWHHRTDAISSVVALAGVGGAMMGLPLLDPLAGLLVSALVVKTGGDIGLDSLRDLTDASLDVELMTAIRATLKNMTTEGVHDVHSIKGRRMGPFTVVDLTIAVDSRSSITAANAVAEMVRRRVKEKHPSMSEVVVHLQSVGHPFQEEIARIVGAAQGEHPQSDMLMDIQDILAREQFRRIKGISHFTPHFIDGQLILQLELVMDADLRIGEAHQLSQELEKTIRLEIDYIAGLDIHAELLHNHPSILNHSLLVDLRPGDGSARRIDWCNGQAELICVPADQVPGAPRLGSCQLCGRPNAKDLEDEQNRKKEKEALAQRPRLKKRTQQEEGKGSVLKLLPNAQDLEEKLSRKRKGSALKNI
eukprot:g11813.t1